jgi:DNA polymerase V
MDYSIYPSHNIAVVDMKSFFASCEAIARGLDPLTTLLAVVGDANRNGSVVLAASPLLKSQYGINTGSRLYEIKALENPNILIVQARMGYYLEISKKITEIFLSFVPPDSLHIYSVDESFLTLDGTERLWGSPQDTAKKIIIKIKLETGLIASVGIGENKAMAKFVLDNFAKHAPEGICECRYAEFGAKFHRLPIEKMWGVGKQLKQHFNHLGIFTFGDLAHFPLETIEKRFGKNGKVLHGYAWGIDLSPVFYTKDNVPASVFGYEGGGTIQAAMKSAGRGITLLRDYVQEEEILLVIRELIEEVCYILRKHHLAGKTVHLSFVYSKHCKHKGFSRQISFKSMHTNDVVDIFSSAASLFYQHHIFPLPVRQIQVSVGSLSEEMTELDSDAARKKRKIIASVSDSLNERFGKGTLITASNLQDQSIARSRLKKVRGHFEK